MNFFKSSIPALAIAFLYKRCDVIVIATCFIFILIAFPILSFGQIQYQKTYNSLGNSQALDMVQTADSGYIITGFSTDQGPGSQDLVLLKTDLYGQQQWVRHYGGSGVEQGHALRQTSDMGILVVGYTGSFGSGFNDVYILKTDSAGNYQWSKTLGGPSTDRAYAISTEINNHFYVAGSTYSFGAGSNDVLVIKMDVTGNIIWRKTFGGADFEEGYDVQATVDGGCVVLGGTRSFGAGVEDMYLIKLDSSGNVDWSNTYGGGDWDQGRSICLTSDGGYALCGFTQSFGMQKHYDLKNFIVKTDSMGSLLWSRTCGVLNSENIPFSIIETSDMGLAFCGYTGDFVGDYRGYLVKLDGLGNLLWSRRMGNGYLNNCNKLIETYDGGLMVAGYTNGFNSGNTAIYILKGDSVGENGCFDSLVTTLIKDTLPVVLVPFDSITEFFLDDSAQTLVVNSLLSELAICENACNLEASFLYEPTPNTVNDTVLCVGSYGFFSNITLGADSFHWEINGISTGSANDTTIFFDSVGIYQIVLVADSSFCQDLATVEIEVVDAAVAGFSAIITNLTASLSVSPSISKASIEDPPG